MDVIENLKTKLLRLCIWFIVKYWYPRQAPSWVFAVYPLNPRVWPQMIVTMTIVDQNAHKYATDSIDEFFEEMSTPTPAPLVPFRKLQGGKMKRFTHHSDGPMISVILVTHSGDVHLLKRALNSLLSQDMDLSQIEVFLYFDGQPTPEEWEMIDDPDMTPLIDAFYSIQILTSQEKNGYYCVGRNRTTPMCNGLYIYNMDADNEIAPNHLSGLLEEIRKPDGDNGFPHFVYSRRKYLVDDGVENPPTEHGTISKLIPWEKESVSRLHGGPKANFVDTGDALYSKSVLYKLADETGCIWSSECRRFGDWDLILRMAMMGARGKAVDQATNLYHWTGSNLQMTRGISDIMAIPEKIYNEMKARGEIIC